MSSDEQDAAIARLVRDRSDAKKKHALLQNELVAAGTILHNLGTQLQCLGTPVSDGAQIYSLIDNSSDLLVPSKLSRNLKEYVELEKTIEGLNKRAKDAGIDL